MLIKIIQFETRALQNEDLLFNRELLCLSAEGRRVEMITLTSAVGIDAETLQRMEYIDGIFPERFFEKRPYNVDRPVIFL